MPKSKVKKPPNHRIRSKKANHRIRSPKANHRIRRGINAEYKKALVAVEHAAKMNQNDLGPSSIRNLYTRAWFDSLSRLKKLLENSD